MLDFFGDLDKKYFLPFSTNQIWKQYIVHCLRAFPRLCVSCIMMGWFDFACLW